VDRGASIAAFSQYPQEEEVLWAPLAFVAPEGPPRLEVTPQGVVRVVPVRATAGTGSGTVEQILGRKRAMHLAAFRFLIAEADRDLRRAAEKDGAGAGRFADDPSKYQGETHSVEGVITRILEQCEVRYRAHEGREAEEYVVDEVFRGLVIEMLDTKAMALSKFRWWLEDRSQYICFMPKKSLRDGHRGLIAYRMGVMAGEAGEQQPATALKLCKLRGLVRERADETNEDGEARLTAAAADGLSPADLRLLVAAKARVNEEDGSASAALAKAAEYGQMDAIQFLLDMNANVDSDGKVVIHAAS
jgi:hypothetical protein